MKVKVLFLHLVFYALTVCSGCAPETASRVIFTQQGLESLRSSYWTLQAAEGHNIPTQNELQHESFREVAPLTDSRSHGSYWLCLYEYTIELREDAPGRGVMQLCLFDDRFRYCGRYWLSAGVFYTIHGDGARVYCRSERHTLVLELRDGRLVTVYSDSTSDVLAGTWEGIE